KAMSIAEELYMSGYISYPRTDNTVYPKSLGIYSILRKLAKSAVFGKEAEGLLENHRPYPTRGRMEATDHPPIHPADVANKEKLSKEAWAIYELVVRRYFATMAPDGTAQESETHISINAEPFKANGYKIIDLGWRKYYPYFKAEESSLPTLAKGEHVEVLSIDLKEDKTKPPKRYSQGALIQEMERVGIGTKSTRAEVIQKLYDRGYVEGGNVIPTKAGIAVTDALKEYSSPIVSPEMTANLEAGMDEIASGSKKIEDIVNISSAELGEILTELQKNERQIGEKIQKILNEQNAMGNCPKCGSPLRIIKSRFGKRFVGCSAYPKCSTTFPLPQKGKLEYTGACATCGSPTVKLIMKGMRPWNICINMQCPTSKERMEARAAKIEEKKVKETAKAEAKAAAKVKKASPQIAAEKEKAKAAKKPARKKAAKTDLAEGAEKPKRKTPAKKKAAKADETVATVPDAQEQ
ncbi:MAG: DNA topoisomerase, partial [Candidatus Thermoplasmatota archaeon]|nr:DNA topoisomerase [Candidatus Thermoplasmatota archaeon]